MRQGALLTGVGVQVPLGAHLFLFSDQLRQSFLRPHCPVPADTPRSGRQGSVRGGQLMMFEQEFADARMEEPALPRGKPLDTAGLPAHPEVLALGEQPVDELRGTGLTRGLGLGAELREELSGCRSPSPATTPGSRDPGTPVCNRLMIGAGCLFLRHWGTARRSPVNSTPKWSRSGPMAESPDIRNQRVEKLAGRGRRRSGLTDSCRIGRCTASAPAHSAMRGSRARRGDSRSAPDERRRAPVLTG